MKLATILLAYLVFTNTAGAYFDAEWISAYRGPGSNFGYPVDLVVDSLGNVYLCGISEGKPDVPHASGSIYHDIATCKLSPTGRIVWVCRYEGAERSMDQPSKIILLENGVVTLGSTAFAHGGPQGVILMYSFDGQLLWKRVRKDAGFSCAVKDDDGNIYLSGGAAASGRSESKIILSKYSSSGLEEWHDTVTFKGTPVVSDLILDDKGACVYVLHGSSGTAKYSLDGRKLWQEPYAMFGPPMAAEVFYTMTRKSKDTFTFDFYNAQGTIVNRFNYGDSKTIISGIKQGQDGGLYVFGTIQRKTCDIFLTKYAEHGKQQWSMAYSNDELNGLKYVVAVDVTADFVYLLGRTQLSETGFGCKLIVLKYDHEGRLVSEYFANASRSVRVFKAVEDSVYIAAQGGPEQGEFLVPFQFNEFYFAGFVCCGT